MTSSTGRFIGLAGAGFSLVLAAQALAADLPYAPRGPYGPPPAAYGLPPPYGPPAYVGRPYFAEASRFDIYGYPVVPAAPNPLYASTGCPPLLQPVYDAVGNFAGYAPVQACR